MADAAIVAAEEARVQVEEMARTQWDLLLDTLLRVCSLKQDSPIIKALEKGNIKDLTSLYCMDKQGLEKLKDDRKTLLSPGDLTSSKWEQVGQEMTKAIKENGKSNVDDNPYEDNYGYGHQIAMSGDGRRIAVSFAGKDGSDRTFGTHVDILSYDGSSWKKDQTVTDVHRGHSHEYVVLFQSLAMSNDGNVVAFSDGHGIAVFALKEDEWVGIAGITDPFVNFHNDAHRDVTHEFGTEIAINCDGTVLAVSGRAPSKTFTKLYRLEERNDENFVGTEWAPFGEIDDIPWGGGIALSASGLRLAMGTVATSSWAGIVQVYDYDGANWGRVGQKITGSQYNEQSGARVSLSASGNIMAVSTKGGNKNRVVAYKLVEHPDEESEKRYEWQPHGQVLYGTGSEHEHFGSDISLSHDGTTLAVGAKGDAALVEEQKNGVHIVSKDVPSLNGRIYVFQFNGNEWWRVDSGSMAGIKDGDEFGRAIGLSADGQWLVGGAPRRTGKTYEQMLGSARVYQVLPQS